MTLPAASSNTNVVALPSRVSSRTIRDTLPSEPTGFASAKRSRRVGCFVPQIGLAAVKLPDNFDPASQPGPFHAFDFRRDGRLGTREDRQLRNHAFLQAAGRRGCTLRRP